MNERKRSTFAEGKKKKNAEDAVISTQIEHALLRVRYAKTVKTSGYLKICTERKSPQYQHDETTMKKMTPAFTLWSTMEEGQATTTTTTNDTVNNEPETTMSNSPIET